MEPGSNASAFPLCGQNKKPFYVEWYCVTSHRKERPIIASEIITSILNVSENDLLSIDSYTDNETLVLEFTLKKHTDSCPFCQSMNITVKDYSSRLLKHSLFYHRSCRLIYRQRRYRCKDCLKTFPESNPFVGTGSNVSNLTILHVLEDLKKSTSTFTQVAEANGISVTKVIDIFDEYIHPPKQRLSEVLCFDEVHTETNTLNKYSFLILDFQSQQLLEVMPDRRKYFLLNELNKYSQEERNGVRYITMDMYETYRIVAKRRFPNAICAVDSFHVIKNLNDKLDTVRKRIMKKYQPGSVEYYLLKKFSWMLGKKEIHPGKPRYNRRLKRYISYDQILEKMLDLSAELREAYEFKIEYQLFNRTADFDTAPEELEKILEAFKNSPVPEIRASCRMLYGWRREIINSFIRVDGRRLSNGIMESRNKIVKMIKNNGNGYQNFERFRRRCLYTMNRNVKPNLSGTDFDIKMHKTK